MNKKFKLLFIFLIVACFGSSQTLSEEVMDFGSNPGNLSLFFYAPQNLKDSAPMVVVLHGCSQFAKSAAELTGWNALADKYGFYVMYPQQHITNNPSHCFNWFKNNEIERGKGECESIKQMVEYMQKKFRINNKKIFITGMSAGAAMSVVMIATQPSMFKAAAIFAGGPYKPGSNIFSSSGSMVWGVNKTPEEWKELVWKENPAFKSKYPKVIVFHGTKDPVVNIRNAHELIEQWTCLHKTDTVPDKIDSTYLGKSDIMRIAYLDKQDEEAVIFYKVKDMGHALPVDPGPCNNQGGKKGIFATDKQFYSTFYTACEFGLIPDWTINGPTEVTAGSKAAYFIDSAGQKKDYRNNWGIPTDSKIVGDNTNSTIEVQFGKLPGVITLEEIAPNGCKYYHNPVQVKIKSN